MNFTRRGFLKRISAFAAGAVAAPYIKPLELAPAIPEVVAATNQCGKLTTFAAMLEAYLPNHLLQEELLKRDYLLGKIK